MFLQEPNSARGCNPPTYKCLQVLGTTQEPSPCALGGLPVTSFYSGIGQGLPPRSTTCPERISA